MQSYLQTFFLFQLIRDLRKSAAVHCYWKDENDIPHRFPVYPRDSCLKAKKWEVILVWLTIIVFCIGILIAIIISTVSLMFYYFIPLFFLSFPITVIAGPLWMLVRNWNYFSRLKSIEVRELFAVTPIPPEVVLRSYLEKPIYWSILPFAVIVVGQISMVFAFAFFLMLDQGFIEVSIGFPILTIFAQFYILWISLFYIYLFSDLLQGFKKDCMNSENNVLGFGIFYSFLRTFVAASAITFLLGFLLLIVLAFIGNIFFEFFGSMAGELVPLFAIIGLTISALIISLITLNIIDSELINTRKAWHEAAKHYYLFE